MPASPEPFVLIVERSAAGVRLDRFVASALSSREDAPSRAELQRWIERGAVTVDGLVKKASDKVREGARIAVQPVPPPVTCAVPEAGIAFQIVHEDASIVVVDKPPGLVVHPARGHQTGTLVNGLLGLGLFDLDGGIDDDAQGEPDAGDKARPGIVHRIDKGTSGLLVVARTARAREKLKAAFAAHAIDREYVAICVGDVRARTFETLHGRSPNDRMKFSSKVREGKRAVTHVRPLESYAKGAATYVACRLETGRTHQIRVHLADTGTPILGDALYGKVPKAPLLGELFTATGRPLLHARVLGFVHPETGEAVRFEVEPPEDFQRVLAKLRSSGA